MPGSRPIQRNFAIPSRVSSGEAKMTTVMAEYIANLDPAVQSFLAAGFCATALVCLTYAGILAAHILDKISDSLAN
jgi:hypothetical protein